MEFQISPKLIPKYAVRMKVDISVVLEEKALIRVSFYDDDNEYIPLEVKLLMLQGEDYKQWGNDDKYIVNYLFDRLGINIPNKEPMNTQMDIIHNSMNEEIKTEVEEAIIEPPQM